MKDCKSSPQSNIVPFYRSASSDRIPHDLAESWKTLLGRSIGRIWEAITLRLLPSDEPRIYEKHDRQGNAYFHVHDPMTGRSFVCFSIQEVRVWLDQRFYHR